MTRGTPSERLARMQSHVRTVESGRNPDYTDGTTPRRLAVDRTTSPARQRRETLADAIAAFVAEEVDQRLAERGL